MPADQTCNPGLDGLYLVDVNQHDIWDKQESAVGNADVWRTACESYKNTSDFKGGIPLKMHQIWIGTRQPPCVWLDTWRVDFMSKYGSSDSQLKSSNSWTYHLWDNESVRNMSMINRQLFDAESAPQCQADILRLELLYKYGGVYIDADIVSTVRDLRPVIKSAQDTGFMITYEPDTKDKPYSVLGNSIIACTPKHPLILMLMSYIKQIYPFKRHNHGVEWVTGPLTYTKVLVHPNMPITIPPSSDFYPAFHYVPNPSAIDLTSLDSYCFQFGYTCSGLSEWVAQNNKCLHAHDCSYHANVEYPLGKLKQFPSKPPAGKINTTIPRIIHQFAFQPQNLTPERWIKTWRDEFCPANGFKYELWTWDRLKNEISEFYCANLYNEGRLDAFCMYMLALEVLHARGGYYVPLSVTFKGKFNNSEGADSMFSCFTNGSNQVGSVLGIPKDSALNSLLDAYKSGSIPEKEEGEVIDDQWVLDMGFSDDISSFISFKNTSRFLGASEIYFVPKEVSKPDQRSNLNTAILWGYDCQVPMWQLPTSADVADSIRQTGQRAVVITDSQFGAHSSLINEIPGIIYKFDQEKTEWDYIVLNVEWEVDHDGLDIYTASSPFKAPTANYVGFIVNTEAASKIESTAIEDVLGKFDKLKVYVASEKSRHTARLCTIYKTMPMIEEACLKLADFYPDFSRDQDEVHENLLKGFRNGQLTFELQVDDEQRAMFRSWSENNSINCECKIMPGVNGIAVEWLRLYNDQTVVHESVGTTVS